MRVVIRFFRNMENNRRPTSIVVACAVIVFVTALPLLRLLQPEGPIDPEFLPVIAGVFILQGFGIVIALVIWFGKGWGRWVYVGWLFLPLVFGIYGDSIVFDRSLSEQFTSSVVGLFTSVLGLTGLGVIVLLFLPISSRWFEHESKRV